MKASSYALESPIRDMPWRRNGFSTPGMLYAYLLSVQMLVPRENSMGPAVKNDLPPIYFRQRAAKYRMVGMVTWSLAKKLKRNFPLKNVIEKVDVVFKRKSLDLNGEDRFRV